MSDDTITRFERDPRHPPTLSKKERARLEAMTDEEIEAAALSDPDAQPLTEEELLQFERVPHHKAMRERFHKSSDGQMLSADRPITIPTDDQFGYAPFARHLAESICKMTSTEGLVMAVYGHWGTGKTSLLNLVRYYIEQNLQPQQPMLVYFNPWWFSGHEDLTRCFFDQLQANLRGRKTTLKNIRKKLADFADVVSNAPLPYASSAKVAGDLLRERQKDITELKAKISDSLKDEGRLLLVFIDDIDRLTSEEMRQLFRVIKSVADFPNIIYLLSFDKRIAVKALEKFQDISGEEYLEKIVQVPFELPLPDKMALRRLLFAKLETLLVDVSQDLLDQTRWGNVYFDGIDHFIATPRDIVRLINTLSVTYTAVKDEVNPIDFIGVETLRVFCPLAYDTMRRNIERFAGHSDARGPFGSDRHADIQAFHNAWITQVRETDKAPVKKLLLRLFPKLESFWGTLRANYGVEWEVPWRKQLRVCTPDIAPTYFRLAIPENSISHADIQTVLGVTNDAKAFGAQLVAFAHRKRSDGTTHVRALLERLVDYTEDDIALDHIRPIVQALFDVGDQLLRPEDESRGMFDSGNDMRIGRLLWRLLPRLDEPQRFTVLQEAISQGKAVATIVDQVAVFGQQHGKYSAGEPEPEEQRLIRSEHLRELEELALQKIREAAQQDILFYTPGLLGTLYRWRDWTNEEEVKQWIHQVIGDNKGLASLLEKCFRKSFSHSASDAVGRTEYRLDPQWLEPFLELSQIVARVRNLATDSALTPNQRMAAEQFIQEYELRQRRENPASSLSRLSRRRR